MPVKGSEIMVQEVAVDAHVIHELGYVSALSGEDHFHGDVIKTCDRRSHFVTSPHRLPNMRVDVLTIARQTPGQWSPSLG